MGTTLDNELRYTHTSTLSIMKFVIVLCLLGLGLCAPRPQEEAVVLPDEIAVEASTEEAPVELALALVEEVAPVEEVVPLPIQSIEVVEPVQAVIQTHSEGVP